MFFSEQLDERLLLPLEVRVPVVVDVSETPIQTEECHIPTPNQQFSEVIVGTVSDNIVHP